MTSLLFLGYHVLKSIMIIWRVNVVVLYCVCDMHVALIIAVIYLFCDIYVALAIFQYCRQLKLKIIYRLYTL